MIQIIGMDFIIFYSKKVEENNDKDNNIIKYNIRKLNLNTRDIINIKV